MTLSFDEENWGLWKQKAWQLLVKIKALLRNPKNDPTTERPMKTAFGRQQQIALCEPSPRKECKLLCGNMCSNLGGKEKYFKELISRKAREFNLNFNEAHFFLHYTSMHFFISDLRSLGNVSKQVSLLFFPNEPKIKELVDEAVISAQKWRETKTCNQSEGEREKLTMPSY